MNRLNIVYNIVINTFAAIVLALVHNDTRKTTERNDFGNKMFKNIVRVTFLMLFFDSLGRFDGNLRSFFPLANGVGNLFLFSMIATLPSVWYLYAHFQIFEDEQKTSKLKPIFIIINIINIIIVLGSQKFGWYYTIDANNIYQRGPFYIVSNFITISMLVAGFILIIKNRNKLEKRYYPSLLFFSVPPLFASFLQTIFYGVSLVLPSVAISILIVFIKIQNKNIYTDYLTGVSNRRRLDTYINNKVKMSNSKKSFSAITLDIDDFKIINDTYGHEVGDQALINTVKLLRSQINENDLIGRSGGDEFWVVLDTDSESELSETVKNIQSAFNKFNKKMEKEYKLKFSYGSGVYDFKQNLSVQEFREKLDKKMYLNKNMTEEN